MANFTRYMRLALLLGAVPSGASRAQAILAFASQSQHPSVAAGRASAAAQVSLETFIQELQTTYKVNFLYRNQLITGRYVAKAHPAFKSLPEALRYVTQHSGLEFELLRTGLYIIVPKPTASAAIPAMPLAGAPESVPSLLASTSKQLVLADVTVTGRVIAKAPACRA